MAYSLTTDKRREDLRKEGAKSHVTNVQNVTTLNQDLTQKGEIRFKRVVREWVKSG